MKHLKGITWNHSRGFLPMVATAQRFGELHPEVQIGWKKRSLQQFADAPPRELASRFDLMVMDHPSIGEAVRHELLLPLDAYLPSGFLEEQERNAVGSSHASYAMDGLQYALAIDAATPIAGWRPDLLERARVALPETWEDVLTLARSGLVTVPAIPIDSLMHFFMLVHALGEVPFAESGRVVSTAVGEEALHLLRELVAVSAPGSLERNPIRTWQMLAESETVAYCPFAYGYSNYSREGYGQHRLLVGSLVRFRGQRLRSTLGGAGLAISRECAHPEEAAAYAAFVASPTTQRTLYTQAGGQPGHRGAWLDPELNRLTQDFFAATLSTLDDAWMRPRMPGFIPFQDAASNAVHAFLGRGGSASAVLERIEEAFQRECQ